MGIPSIQAGGVLCEMSGWTVSNLQLQKLLYIAHMFHLGEKDGKRLINENFEAWRHGPVEPKLYHHCKGFGADAISNIFPWDIEFAKDSSYYQTLENTYEALKNTSGGKLIGITHWKKGAWYKVFYGSGDNFFDNSFTNGLFVKTIPNKLIKKEYEDRLEENSGRQ